MVIFNHEQIQVSSAISATLNSYRLIESQNRRIETQSISLKMYQNHLNKAQAELHLFP